jgi:hypothetical protein
MERNSCCIPSTYCMRASDNSIGCCPWGQTCNSVVAGGGGVAPQPSTWQPQPSTWQPQPEASTIYITQTHPTTTIIYAAGGQGQGQGQTTQQVTTVYPGLVGVGQGQQGQQGQQYCSTLYAHGGNLPTTEAGTCGTILIANAAVRRGEGMGKWLWWCVGLVLVGMVLGMGMV